MLSGLRRIVQIVPTVRQVSTSGNLYLDQNWRQERGLPDNPNRESVLRDLPDYSFLDGRPTPYGSRHRFRVLKQREYTAKIIELTKEVDDAVKIHSKKQQDKEDEIQRTLSKRLKKKGNKTLDS